MTLESSKILGGIGALLMFIGVLPYISFFGIIELVGLILVLAALHGFADYYKERAIFTNALYAVIAGIVGAVIAVAVAIFTFLTTLTNFIYTIYPGWNGDWTTLQGLTPDTSNFNFQDVIPLLAGIVLVFIVAWVFAIIAAFFMRRSLRLVSVKSGVGLFSTTGLLMLVGAVLIIIGIGALLMWIAALILAIAFFTMKPKEPPSPTAAYSPPTPV